MTHFSQPSNGNRSATANAGGSSLQGNQHPPGALAGFYQSLDLSQDDIVRPELRNDAMLAGKPARERRT